MNTKKILPFILFAVLAVLAIFLRRCNNQASDRTTSKQSSSVNKTTQPDTRLKLDRNATDLYFTKHAKCRMQCRHISQQEVRDILLNGKVNYNKSDLNDPQGPTYAVEGITKDRQHVRIIFAPKQRHLSVVTVIDLDNDYECDCA